MPFFITGLPRSRTAWLANFLTWDGTMCGHELMFGLTKETYADELSKWSGAAETLLPIRWPEIEAVLDSSPVIVIQREPHEVAASLRRLQVAKADLATEWMQGRLETFIQRFPNAVVFPYRSLTREDTLQMIWQHCTGKPAQPVNRVRMLAQFNVQVTQSRFAEFLEPR